MIINPVTYAEREYSQPFAEIVAGFAADGQSLARTAAILHVEFQALQDYAARQSIKFTGHNCPPAEPSAALKQARRNQSPRYCFRGLDLSPIEWSERTGIPRKTITRRIERGWPVAKALTTPPLNRTEVAAIAVNARRSK
jgi:hypothetical protein